MFHFNQNLKVMFSTYSSFNVSSQSVLHAGFRRLFNAFSAVTQNNTVEKVSYGSHAVQNVPFYGIHIFNSYVFSKEAKSNKSWTHS